MKCTCMLTLMIIAGPPEKEKYFHKIEEDGLPIHHDKDGSARKAYMNEHENWGKAAVSIFSSAVFQWKKSNYCDYCGVCVVILGGVVVVCMEKH